jgi:hypothetical protein
VSWSSTAITWPLLKRLNKKNGLAFTKSIRSLVQKRISLPKDAKHDLYSIAGDVGNGGERLGRSELWAEAVFFFFRQVGYFSLSKFFFFSLFLTSGKSRQVAQLSPQHSVQSSSISPETHSLTRDSRLRFGRLSPPARISEAGLSYLIEDTFARPSMKHYGWLRPFWGSSDANRILITASRFLLMDM